MKKLIFIIALSLSLSVQAVELDHFINPLFYEELHPVSKVALGLSYFLTPTSAECRKKEFEEDGCEWGSCRLIDQTEILYVQAEHLAFE